MRQGFRVIDTDTHVNPTLEVLLRYADQDLRDCLDELKPFMRTVKPRPGQGDAENQETATILSIKPLRYQRVAGEKLATTPTEPGGDRGFLSGRTPRGATSTSSSLAPGPLVRLRWPRISPEVSIAPITGTWPITAEPTHAG